MTRIDQIAVVVNDLDEALETYRRAFGLEPIRREVIAGSGIEEAMIDIGGVYLQLIQSIADDSPVASFLATRGPGLHHIGFGVASIDEALEHLKSIEAPLIDDRPRPGGGGHDIAFVHPDAAHGVLVELVQG